MYPKAALLVPVANIGHSVGLEVKLLIHHQASALAPEADFVSATLQGSN